MTMSKKMKKRRDRIVCGALMFVLAICAKESGFVEDNNAQIILFLIAYFITGYDVIRKAVRNIRNGQIFDENFLMVIASVGAFLISEMSEAVGVMLFYQIGEFFQDYAVNRSRGSIAALMDIRPECANLKKDGEIREVSPDEVHIGDIFVIKPGERIPLDGIVVKGESMLDTMAITGEPVPRTVREGEELLSGCINKDGVLEARAVKEYSDSTVSRILELVENASSRKAETENFITKFARYYTPAVVSLAALIALIPSLITGNPSVWVYRALSFLVISCPCALVISVPLSFFGGIGAASQKGILVKGSNYLEALANMDTVVFDKTGTLTKGVFKVTQVLPSEGFSQRFGDGTYKELLRVASLAESFSTHPIAMSIMQEATAMDACDESLKASVEPSDIKEISGNGVRAVIDGSVVLCGNKRLIGSEGIALPEDLKEATGTHIYVAVDGMFAGRIIISDELKEDSRDCIEGLKRLSVRTVMLTGDHKITADIIASELGIDEAYSELLPADKVEIAERLLSEEKNGGKLLFMGDGINDAPVLARADIGAAMGGLGSDAAIEAADIVFMTDEPSKLLLAYRISKKTLRIVKENIIFAIGVKLIILLLAAFGLASMWAAVFADVGVAVIALINAMRAMRA